LSEIDRRRFLVNLAKLGVSAIAVRIAQTEAVNFSENEQILLEAAHRRRNKPFFVATYPGFDERGEKVWDRIAHFQKAVPRLYAIGDFADFTTLCSSARGVYERRAWKLWEEYGLYYILSIGGGFVFDGHPYKHNSFGFWEEVFEKISENANFPRGTFFRPFFEGNIQSDAFDYTLSDEIDYRQHAESHLRLQLAAYRAFRPKGIRIINSLWGPDYLRRWGFEDYIARLSGDDEGFFNGLDAYNYNPGLVGIKNPRDFLTYLEYGNQSPEQLLLMPLAEFESAGTSFGISEISTRHPKSGEFAYISGLCALATRASFIIWFDVDATYKQELGAYQEGDFTADDEVLLALDEISRIARPFRQF